MFYIILREGCEREEAVCWDPSELDSRLKELNALSLGEGRTREEAEARAMESGFIDLRRQE